MSICFTDFDQTFLQVVFLTTQQGVYFTKIETKFFGIGGKKVNYTLKFTYAIKVMIEKLCLFNYCFPNLARIFKNCVQKL